MELIETLGVIVEACGVKYAIKDLPNTFNKLIKVLLDPSTSLHNTKIAAANVLKLFAQELLVVADVVIGFYQESVMEALEFAAKDRVLKVQQAARAAIKEWKKLKEAHKDIEAKKMIEEVPDLDEEELFKMRLKEDCQRIPQRTYEIKEEKQPVQFLKKRMGTGGGYVELENEPQAAKFRKNLQPIKEIGSIKLKNYKNAMKRYSAIDQPVNSNEYDKKEENVNFADTITFGKTGEIEHWHNTTEKGKKGDYEEIFNSALKSGITLFKVR